MHEDSSASEYEIESLVINIKKKKSKELDHSEISILYEKPSSNLEKCLTQKQCKLKNKECYNKGESQLFKPEVNCTTVPDIYKLEKRKKKLETLKISEYESSKLFDNINKNYKDEENSDISIVYENSQKRGGENLVSKKHCKRKASCDKGEREILSLQPEFDCSVYKAKKKKRHSKEIETLQSKSSPTSVNIDENKRKKKIKECGNSEISFSETFVSEICFKGSKDSNHPECELPVLEKIHKKKKKSKGLENSEGSIEYDTPQEKSHKKKKCKEPKNYDRSIEYDTSQEEKSNTKKKCKGLENSEGSIEYDTSQEKSHKKKKCKGLENSEGSIEYDTSQEEKSHKKKKCKGLENYDGSIEYATSQEEKSHKKKKCKGLENYVGSIEYDTSQEEKSHRKKKCKGLENSEGSVEYDTSQEEKSHKKKKKEKCKGLENYEGSIEFDTSQEPSIYSVEKYFSKNKTKFKNNESYEDNAIPNLQPDPDCSTISEYIYQQKKMKGTFKGSKDSYVPECESPASENILKKKRRCKKREKSEVLVEYKSLQEPISNLETVSFNEKHKLKHNESYEKHVIPNLHPDPEGIVIPNNVCQQKKRKRNYKGLNVPECKLTALENIHDKKTAFVSVPEANSRILDENDLGIKENNSSVILGNPKKPEELKDSEVSMDYERKGNPKKRKRDFDGLKDSNVLECESPSLENSYKKEMNKITTVSVLKANSSEFDDDLGTKEKNRSIILDIKEEPIKFPIPPLHEKESLKGLTKEEKNVLKSRGVEIKQGKFSSSEDAILRKNYEEFCSTFKVNDPCFLLGIGRNKKPEAGVLNFFKAKHFYARLGRNLNNRSLYSIYQRARVLFNPYRNIKIKESLEEKLEKVVKYQKKLGNKWQHIGALVEKTNSEVRKCFEWNCKHIKKGGWTPEEEEILTFAIHSLVKIPNVSAKHSNLIPWSKVADLVPTRNASQCRLHWGEYMAWEPDAKRKPWTKEKDEELVKELISRGKINECEIDWEDVHKCFKDFAPSHMFLRKRFRKLKTKKEFQCMLEKSGLLLEGH